MTSRIGGRFVSNKKIGGDTPDDSVYGLGVHLLAVTTVFSICIIFILIPELSYKPIKKLRLEDISADQLLIVPNRIIRIGTQIKKTNRINGDRQIKLSQDLLSDDIVLAPKSLIDGDFTVMVQGDYVPIHAELLDVVPWMSVSKCHKQCEELGFLIA